LCSAGPASGTPHNMQCSGCRLVAHLDRSTMRAYNVFFADYDS
jgi:hypothetical protein